MDTETKKPVSERMNYLQTGLHDEEKKRSHENDPKSGPRNSVGACKKERKKKQVTKEVAEVEGKPKKKNRTRTQNKPEDMVQKRRGMWR